MASSHSVNAPNRMEDIQQFMVSKYPTSRMLFLQGKLESSSTFADRKKFADQMYTEFMKIHAEVEEESRKPDSTVFSMVRNIFGGFWPSATEVDLRKDGSKDDFLQETLRWLNYKLPYFHHLWRNIHVKNQLFVGKVQSGKTVASVAFSMVKMLEGQPCVMILLNSIGSTQQIEDKCNRFFAEHAEHMNKIFSNFTQFGVVLAGGMSQRSYIDEDDGFEKKVLLNFEDALEAMEGNSNKIILVMNNGHQLQYMNKLVSSFDVLPFTMLCDEADAVAYGLVKDERSDINAAFEFGELKKAACQTVEVSATVWDILVGNRDLSSSAITEITTTGPYKRTSDLITQTFTCPMPKKLTKVDDDVNLVPCYLELSKIVPFGVEHNRATPHPIIVLHKTNTKHAEHDAFVDFFRAHPDLSDKWCVIREDSRGILISCISIAKEDITIDNITAPANPEGVYEFPKKIDIQQVLFALKQFESVTHIVIKSGGCCSRSKSYVSQDGDIHLTHEYYYPGAKERSDVPSIVQAVRLHHNRPDAVPLTLITTQQIASDLRKGDLMQAEIIERLSSRDDCSTFEQVPEETWNKNKVPKASMIHSDTNKGFKVQKNASDGGWALDVYKHEVAKIVPAGFEVDEELAEELTSRDQINEEQMECVLVHISLITGGAETLVYYDTTTVLTSLGLNAWHRRAEVQSSLATTFPDRYGTHMLYQRFKATTKTWGRSSKKHVPCEDSAHGLLMKKVDSEWVMKLCV
jgi:hypothetical protein